MISVFKLLFVYSQDLSYVLLHINRNILQLFALQQKNQQHRLFFIVEKEYGYVVIHNNHLSFICLLNVYHIKTKNKKQPASSGFIRMKINTFKMCSHISVKYGTFNDLILNLYILS